MRFPEFSGEWHKDRIRNLFTTNVGGDIDKAKVSNIQTDEFKYPVIANALSHDGIYGYTSEYKDDSPCITVTGRGDVGCAKYRDYPLFPIVRLLVLHSKGKIDCRFGEHAINSIKKYEESTGVPQLTAPQLGAYSISFPNLTEQAKIGAFLKLIDERISTQNRIIEKTKSLIKGLANLIMDNPSDCIKYLLGDLCEIKSGYSGNQLVGNNGLRVSRIETISNQHINLDRVGFVAPFEKSEEYKLNIGDILFSNINSVEYIGNTAYIDKDYSLYHGMNLLRLIPQKPIVSPFFLYCLLNTDRLKNHFKTICNKAVSQASINQTELSKTPLLLPDMPKQIQIANLFKLLLGKKEIELSYYTRLIKQKKYLLSKLFI